MRVKCCVVRVRDEDEVLAGRVRVRVKCLW